MHHEEPIPDAPAGLHPAGLSLWRTVCTDYGLEPWQLSILETACRAKSQEARCEELLAAEGYTVTTGAGMVRARPEATVLRDARAAFLRAMAALRLEVE